MGGVERERALIWGNGKVLRQNIFWIKQIYEIVGITDSEIDESCPLEEGRYAAGKALTLEYDVILIASGFYDEIVQKLINVYGIDKSKIRFFEDEFEQERRMSFGTENEDVTFYVMRAHWKERYNGLFNFWMHALMTYYHTERDGHELLIDMKNYYTEYARDGRYGRVNIWEEYFRQPSEYTLEDVYRSKNVILSRFSDDKYCGVYLSKALVGSVSWYAETYQKLGELYPDWTRLSAVLEMDAQEEEKKLKRDGRVLGVLARGTDFFKLKPEGHFIPCETNRFISCTKEYMDRYGYKYVYLATEDAEILGQFKRAFDQSENTAGRLIYTEQARVSDTGNEPLMNIRFNRENDEYLRGKEYCMVIWMLSKCDGFLANCLCGGVLGAVGINGGKYSEVEVIDSGKYGRPGAEG